MIRAAFLSFYRSLTRHPLYSALNLLGLSFGIAVFIVLSLFVRFETSYEQWLPNADRIYVLTHQNARGIRLGVPTSYYSPGNALEAARKIYPGVKSTRLFTVYPTIRYRDALFDETGQLVDPEFFSIFDLPTIAGDRNAALAAPDGLILSERMARKIFGRTDVIGAQLYLQDDIVDRGEPGKAFPWRVLAITKNIPANSTLKFDIVRSVAAFHARLGFPYLWYYWSRPQTNRTFFEFSSMDMAVRSTPQLLAELRAFPIPYSEDVRAKMYNRLDIDFRPFKDQHLSDPHLREALSGLGVSAWLALAVALINYVNLATARAELRLREVVVRNVNGASRPHIQGQLLIEALFSGGVSLAIALSLVEIGVPILNRVGGLSLSLDYVHDGLAFLGLSAVVLSGALLAGSFPARVLSGYQRVWGDGAFALLGNRHNGRRLREGLTIVQFASAGAFLIIVTGFTAQVHHMETSDLGYSRDRVLITGSLITSPGRTKEVVAVTEAWRRIPGIEGVASGPVPGQNYLIPSFPARPANALQPSVDISFNSLAFDFFKVYRPRVLAGRPVDARDDVRRTSSLIRAGDGIQSKTITINVDIDSSAIKAFGFQSPQAALGQDLRFERSTLHIVGVISNQRFQSPARKSLPAVYYLDSTTLPDSEVAIRFSGIDEATAVRHLEFVFRQWLPDIPFQIQTIRQELDYYYRDDRKNTELFAIGGGVAALIGAVGLFGMAAFNTPARVHEIGIRKSQGASRGRILRLLMFQFLRPVLIANVIAWPIAYFVLDGWLKQFDDRVAMSPWFFLAGSGLSLLIAAVTVFGVAWSGASLSPAKALRQL